MSVDSAEFEHEMSLIEQARAQDIVATRAELAATLRVAGEQLEHAARLSSTLRGQLHDLEFVEGADGLDAQRWIADAARNTRAAHRSVTSLL